MHKTLPIEQEVDVAMARLAGREMAAHAGFGDVQTQCIVTSISELASNIVFHADRGSIDLHIVERADGMLGFEVTATDAGKGIADVSVALRDGASTRGGLGGGLPGVGRLMSEMTVASTVGRGTVVRAVKWLDEGAGRQLRAYA